MLWKSFLYFLKKSFPNFQETELFLYFRRGIFRTLDITNVSYISGKVSSEPWHNGTFLILLEMELSSLIFLSELEKKKKNPTEKNFYILGKVNFLALILKTNYIFLYFRKQKPWKNFLHFIKRKLVLYSGKQNFFIFQETETVKYFLYFRK